MHVSAIDLNFLEKHIYVSGLSKLLTMLTEVNNFWLSYFGTGAGTAGTSSQGSSGDGMANNNVSPHQTRLQAAAAAAAIYEKSFVYPSPNALTRYSSFKSL